MKQKMDFSVVLEETCPRCLERLQPWPEEEAGRCPRCSYGFRVQQLFPEARMEGSFVFTVIPPAGFEFTSTSKIGIEAVLEARR